MLYSVVLLAIEKLAKGLYTKIMGRPFAPGDALGIQRKLRNVR